MERERNSGTAFLSWCPVRRRAVNFQKRGEIFAALAVIDQTPSVVTQLRCPAAPYGKDGLDGAGSGAQARFRSAPNSAEASSPSRSIKSSISLSDRRVI